MSGERLYASRRVGTVAAVNAGPPPTATISLGGDTSGATVDAPYLDGYAPVVGDSVVVLTNQGAPFVLGRATALSTRRSMRVSRAAQLVGSGTVTILGYDTLLEDTHDFIAPLPTNTFVVPAGQGGVYAVTVNVIAAFTGRTFLEVVPTSTLPGTPAQLRQALTPAEGRGVCAVPSLPLDDGDSFVCQFFHSTGAALNVASWLSVVRVSP